MMSDNPICPDCGNKEDLIELPDGDSFYHCWHCEQLREAEQALYDDYYEHWMYDQYRRMDAEDMAQRMEDFPDEYDEDN